MIDARMKPLMDLVNASAAGWEFPEQGPPEKAVGEVHITYEPRHGFNIYATSHNVRLIPQEFGDTTEFQAAKKALERQIGEARAMPDILALRQLAFGEVK